MSKKKPRKLSDIIRWAGSQEDESGFRPDEDALRASLEGRASDEQRADVQRALNESAAFRSEYKQMMLDYAALDRSSEAVQGSLEGTILPAGLRRRMEAEYPSDSSEKEPGTPGLLGRLFRSKLLQVSVVGAALALIAITQFPRNYHELDLRTADIRVDKNELIAVASRGDSQTRSFATGRDAANAGFRTLLEYDESGDSFISTEPNLPLTLVSCASSKGIVDLCDESRRRLGSIDLNFKAPADSLPTELRLWMIDLETRELHKGKLTSSSGAFIIRHNATHAVVTYSYGDRHYVAGGTSLRR